LHDAKVFAFGTDQAYFGGPDLVVDARAGVALRRRVVRSASYGFVPSMVNVTAKFKAEI
jgi:hypothetical protein